MKRFLFFAVCLVAALGTPKLLAAEAPQPQAQVPSIEQAQVPSIEQAQVPSVEQAAPACNSASTAKNPLDLVNLLRPVQADYCCQNARIACRANCAPCHFVFVCQVNNCAADCECTC